MPELWEGLAQQPVAEPPSLWPPVQALASLGRAQTKYVGTPLANTLWSALKEIGVKGQRVLSGVQQYSGEQFPDSSAGGQTISTDEEPVKRVVENMDPLIANLWGVGSASVPLGAVGSTGGKLVQPAMGSLAEAAPPFYSAAQRAVESAKLGKGTPEQWTGYLRNQPGVKAEEMDWLFGNLPKEGMLTKEQMQAHAAENAVTLGEVNKGRSALAPQEQQELNTLRQRMNVNELTAPEYRRIEDLEHREAYGMNNTTKFQRWQLPGGENYRETLLTLPDRSKAQVMRAEADKRGYPDRIADWPDQEFAQRYRNEITNNPDVGSENFRSSHWDEPNVLAHVRMNDREIPPVAGGRNQPLRSLHLEEIQSDWHQKGRTQGYRADQEAKMAALVKERDAIARETHDTARSGAEYTPEIGARIERMNELHDQIRELGISDVGVPDAPFKSTWADLSLKRMIREASEKGYDAVSWTPGEAQVARYDLSKHIDSMNVQRLATREGDLYEVHAVTKDGERRRLGAKPASELPDIVGKEMAERITKNAEHKQNYTGLDLKVGGEGMKAFYDKMLVDKANALGKKHGARVEQSSLPKQRTMDEIATELGYGGWHSGLTAEQKATVGHIFDNEKVSGGPPVHVLRITPQLREAAMKGFPLFSLGAGGAALAPGLFNNDAQPQINTWGSQ